MSQKRVTAFRHRQKIAALAAMRECLCPDCGVQLTVENVADIRTYPRCLDCSYERRGQATQRKRKVLPLPVTSAPQAVTSARSSFNSTGVTSAVTSAPLRRDIDLIVEDGLVVKDFSSEEKNSIKAYVFDEESANPKIASLPVRPSSPPPLWPGPELEERRQKIAEWWLRRTSRVMSKREAYYAAELSLPIFDLLSALERVWRRAKSNGFEARTLKPLWSDLKVAESDFYKRGAAKPRPDRGMRSLAEVLGHPS